MASACLVQTPGGVAYLVDPCDNLSSPCGEERHPVSADETVTPWTLALPSEDLADSVRLSRAFRRSQDRTRVFRGTPQLIPPTDDPVGPLRSWQSSRLPLLDNAETPAVLRDPRGSPGTSGTGRESFACCRFYRALLRASLYPDDDLDGDHLACVSNQRKRDRSSSD